MGDSHLAMTLGVTGELCLRPEGHAAPSLGGQGTGQSLMEFWEGGGFYWEQKQAPSPSREDAGHPRSREPALHVGGDAQQVSKCVCRKPPIRSRYVTEHRLSYLFHSQKVNIVNNPFPLPLLPLKSPVHPSPKITSDRLPLYVVLESAPPAQICLSSLLLKCEVSVDANVSSVEELKRIFGGEKMSRRSGEHVRNGPDGGSLTGGHGKGGRATCLQSTGRGVATGLLSRLPCQHPHL